MEQCGDSCLFLLGPHVQPHEDYKHLASAFSRGTTGSGNNLPSMRSDSGGSSGQLQGLSSA